MNEDEYREFLSFLFERYVRPRLARALERHFNHFGWEISHHLNQAIRSARLFRFIESDCNNDEEVYQTFTLERITTAVHETNYSVGFSNSLTDRSGFLDAIESHLPEIADGLSTIYLPEADEDVLRQMGSPNPRVELRSLVYRAKRWMERRDGQRGDLDLRHQLQYAEQRLKKEADDYQERVKAKKEPQSKEEKSQDIPMKGRAWFKSIAHITEGAALSIANISLTTGILQLPVSIETQTWGSITSVSVGLSRILCGIGELRNE
jgi:hypothetical protein